MSEAPDRKRKTSLRVTSLADVVAEDVQWLWPGRIPLGKVTLLVGAPGGGKSFVTLDVAARVSRGAAWLDSTVCPLGDLILANAEDGAGDTIRPRFDAAGGDASRVGIVEGVNWRDRNGDDRVAAFTLAEMPLLLDAVKARPGCKLLIIDPIGSYIGSKTDTHRDNEVRALLEPLSRLAAECNLAVIVVMHTRKSGGSADDRALGSRAFVGLARVVHHLVRDAENPKRRLFLPGKNNLAIEGDGLAFTIDGDPAGVRWESAPVTTTADDAYAAADSPSNPDGARKPGPSPRKQRDAMECLASLLAVGPMAVKTIEAEAKAAGVSMRTMQRAADDLGVKREKCSYTGGWTWRLPRDGQGLPMLPASVAENLAKSSSAKPHSERFGNLAYFDTSAVNSPVSGGGNGEGDKSAQRDEPAHARKDRLFDDARGYGLPDAPGWAMNREDLNEPPGKLPVWRLTLRALPDRVPPETRLRRLLKVVLRAHGMRCEAIEPAQQDENKIERGERRR